MQGHAPLAKGRLLRCSKTHCRRNIIEVNRAMANNLELIGQGIISTTNQG
jgi:hypothetical protein